MSRLTTLIQSKDLKAKSIAGYCANHPCPTYYYCEHCMAQFHNKENLGEFLECAGSN